MPLAITLKEGDWIQLGDNAKIVVTRVGNKQVTVAVICPKELKIFRSNYKGCLPCPPLKHESYVPRE